MNLDLALLERCIELPTKDPQELRHILDDLGLEVKDLEQDGERTVFTIETLANRGDHLYALGVAREFSARYLTALKHPKVASELSDRKPSLVVSNTTERCLRYAIMEMELAEEMSLRSEIAAVMPDADPERHPIVHILNYILLEMGQPMHAFDRSRIEGELVVVLSDKPEEIEALDGQRYTVPAESILIRDSKKIVAVAGVIGCANSMCQPDTRRVLIESATFDPVSVRKTARAMGISTDASYTFERGADREAVIPALKRLAYLAAGTGSVVSTGDSSHVLGLTYLEGGADSDCEIPISMVSVRKEMNLPRLSEVEVTTRLKHLGYTVETVEDKKQYRVTVPSWRQWSVQSPAAVVEDIVRVQGVNKVKLDLPDFDVEIPESNENDKVLACVESALLGQGFLEVITKSYYSANELRLLQEFDPNAAEQHIALKNAVEKGYSHMKTTNVIHMAQLIERNLRQGVTSCKVYECGRLFVNGGVPSGNYELEFDALSIAVAGRWTGGEWKQAETFEDLASRFKGLVEAIGFSLGALPEFKESKVPFLHPGRQARVVVGRTELGFLGALHPLLRDKLDLSQEMLYAELQMAQLAKVSRPVMLADTIDLPTIRRDITIGVPMRSPAGKVSAAIEDTKVPNLKSVAIVDEFVRPDEDFRRVTYRITFQSPERTLEHSEVDTIMESVLTSLKEKHGMEMVG